MWSVTEHAARIEGLLDGLPRSIGIERVALDQALERVAAYDIRSPVDLPLFRNSQMDGFAVRAADVSAVPATLPVVADIPAGRGMPGPLARGAAARIMTGAMMPDGADSVVPVERASLRTGPDGGLAGASVRLDARPTPGDHVRERGSDLRAGAVLVPAGMRMAPRHLAALAAAGRDEIDVRRRPRVAVITTGSELVPPRGPATHGQVYDSNRIALASGVVESGGEVVFQATCGDETSAFLALLGEATRLADLVVTSGGISQGAYEVVRESLEPLGASVGHVGMQPGGPQAVALVDGTPVICFPGNPVSTQVSFVVFLRPVLRRIAGLAPMPPRTAPLAREVSSVAGKRQFLRGRTLPGGAVEPLTGSGSHLVAAMAGADVLIDVPVEISGLVAGQNVEVWEL